MSTFWNAISVNLSRRAIRFARVAAEVKDAAATLTAKLKDGKGHMKAAAADAKLKALVQWSLAAK